ncbi:MAG TPA: putative Ig domain-containing protein, partial [Aggregatilineales bacterium]|nr:putative Ig domain-containing protein [Aggregatilineales bacterium]
GTAYSHTYTASGTAPISFALTSGALPPGLTLSSAGVLSGNPTTAGTFTGTVTASNGVAPNASQPFSITINSAPVAPSITSAAPASGTVGTAYSHTYTASGTTPITFALTSGALPPGLTLTTAGVLSGNPTTAGTFTGTVTASNGVAPNASQPFSITINPAPVAPSITSAAPASGTVGTAYSHTYTASGTAPISFALTSGALPPGLTLSSAGVLSGNPTTAGTFTGTVTASNGVAPNASQPFSITINPAPVAPSITSAAPASGTVGTAYSHTYTASGTAPISFTLTSGALPPGLTLTTAGVLSGNPTTAGTFTGTVTASNGVAPNASQPFSITIVSAGIPGELITLFAHDNRYFHGNMFNVTVNNPLQITAFDVNIEAGPTTVSVYYRGGTYVGFESNPAAWTLLGSDAVVGAGLNNRTRVNVSSPLLSPGTYGFYLTVTPIFDEASSVDMYYTAGTQTYSTADMSLVAGVGVGGNFGDAAACTSRGFANNPCIFPSRTWNGAILYSVVPTAPAITSAAPSGGTVGAAYTHTYTATGTAPITFTVTSGALPPGLTLSSAGVISGTPTTAGTYSGIVTAANGVSPTATQSFNITIAPAAGIAPTITSAAPLGGTVGTAYSHTYTASGTTPISFALTSGALPPGLTLSTAGVLSGNPTTAGTFTGTVTASNGTNPNATQSFSITIAPASTGTAPTITSAAPAGGMVGAAYSHTYTATGTTPISYWVSAGNLPPGLTLTAGGVLSGTPTTTGSYSGEVTAGNGTAPNATQAFNITISTLPTGGAPAITSALPWDGTVGIAYTHSFVASGNNPITFALTSGQLPPGIVLSSNGGMSGTPNTAGTYSGVVTASNGIAPNATQAFTIIIYPPNNTGGNSVTTLFAHDNRQFHGNMFDVTVTNPLQITGFDMSVGWGQTTVSVYYRNGSYVGNETNPAAWTLLGSVRVTGQGPNNRTPIAISTPVLPPGVYGFYAAVTPIFDVMSAVDLHYSAGTLTVGTADLSISAGNGVGGIFGDPAACVYRNYPNNPCIFNDRIWNGTIYYTPVGGIPTSSRP